jgi:hypothetical protein
MAMSPRWATQTIAIAAGSRAGLVITAAPAASPAPNAVPDVARTANIAASATHIVAGTSLIGCFA